MDNPTIHLPPLMVHCMVERLADGQWQAFSLEFGLAAQADTEAEVKHKLAMMIASYLYDALVGEDRDHAGELLARRATLGVYLRYYRHRLMSLFSRDGADDGIYRNPVPLAPIGCPAE